MDIRLKVLLHEKKAPTGYDDKNVTFITGDLRGGEPFCNPPAPGSTVINLIYLRDRSGKENLRVLENLAEACKRSGIKRFIHCSTAVVVGRTTEMIINEDTVPYPVHDYEAEKLAMEKMLTDKYGTSFEIIILRPTAVFGPGGQNLIKMADSLSRGKPVINYARSCLYNYRRMNLVPVENVAAAIEFLAFYEMAGKGPEIFIVSDDEDDLNAYRKIEQLVMNCLGLADYPVPVVPIPLTVLKLLLKYTRKTNYNPYAVYSCRKLLDAGFVKRVTLKESVPRFVVWYKERCFDEGPQRKQHS